MSSSIVETMMAGGELSVKVVISAVEEGGFTAECVDIPGCCSEGETEQEVEANIRKAIDACLSVIFEDSLSRIKPKLGSGIHDMPLGAKYETIAITLPRLQEAACA